ncbi:hypothetical protein [Accumulibacter sp.]|uniref:hypothetical protein n=1 Tax=Accumulibacter sp. TaxID=2053492 RepID=UPI0035B22CF9
MSSNRENFNSWYKKVLATLYPSREAGFAILLVAFPLLERYLRQKTGLSADQVLSNAFYEELARMFPELRDQAISRRFWQVYRNGLLHQITLSRQNRGGVALPVGWLSHDKPRIVVASDGSMWLHPVEFAQHVVCVIEGDFETFEGQATAPPLPKVRVHVDVASTAAPPYRTLLGTNTES